VSISAADRLRRIDVNRSSLGLGAVTAAVVGWGFGGILVKVATADGFTLSFFRLWLGALVMAVAALATGRRLTWRTFRRSFWGGVFFAADVGCFFSALKLTSVADVTLIGALQPALVLVVAGRWFGEKVDLRKALWTVVSMVGVALVVLGSSGTPIWSLGGDLLGVGALLAWTAYWLISKRVRVDTPTTEYMTAISLIAAAALTPVVLLSGQDLGQVRGMDWLWLGIIVLGPGVGGHFLMNWAHRYVAVSVSSLMAVGVPVVAVVGAAVFLHEPLGPLQAIGALIALGAITVILRTPAVRTEEGASAPGPAVPPSA
jgi:drug/metabolite transporter (DMT)-like permease